MPIICNELDAWKHLLTRIDEEHYEAQFLCIRLDRMQREGLIGSDIMEQMEAKIKKHLGRTQHPAYQEAHTYLTYLRSTLPDEQQGKFWYSFSFERLKFINFARAQFVRFQIKQLENSAQLG